MKRWKGMAGLLGIAVVVMAGVGVACGGGEGEKAGSPEDYARAFCEALGKHADDFAEVVGTVEGTEDIQDVGELRGFLSDMGPLLESMAEDLDKIDPPEDAKRVHEGIVAALSDGAEAVQELGEILDKPMEEAVAALPDFEERTEGLGEGLLGELGDLPAEYQTAFESEPKCQEIKEMMEEMMP